MVILFFQFCLLLLFKIVYLNFNSEHAMVILIAAVKRLPCGPATGYGIPVDGCPIYCHDFNYKGGWCDDGECHCVNDLPHVGK